MKPLSPVSGSILFFFLAPGTVAGLAPWLISGWRFHAAFLGADTTRFLGAALIFACIDIAADSFARFAVLGEGTPVPLSPTRRLVVSGFYRHVRNPMYIAVLGMIVGQALLFGNEDLLLYAASVWVAFFAFIVLYEEPALSRTFGGEYAVYCAHVGRWIPRWTPWRAE